MYYYSILVNGAHEFCAPFCIYTIYSTVSYSKVNQQERHYSNASGVATWPGRLIDIKQIIGDLQIRLVFLITYSVIVCFLANLLTRTITARPALWKINVVRIVRIDICSKQLIDATRIYLFHSINIMIRFARGVHRVEVLSLICFAVKVYYINNTLSIIIDKISNAQLQM